MKTCLIICSMLVVSCLFSQTDSIARDKKYRYGLQFGGSFNTLIGQPLINPIVTQSNDKHQFEFGPKFYTGAWNPEGVRFGFEVNYKYYPNTKVTPFSSFLLLNSELYYEKGTVYYTDYNSIPNEVHQVTRTWTTQIAAIQIGYGIEYRFLSQFYLTTDVSFGGYYQETDGARISDEPLLNSEWSNGFFGLSTRMGLSLGWRFKK